MICVLVFVGYVVCLVLLGGLSVCCFALGWRFDVIVWFWWTVVFFVCDESCLRLVLDCLLVMLNGWLRFVVWYCVCFVI